MKNRPIMWMCGRWAFSERGVRRSKSEKSCGTVNLQLANERTKGHISYLFPELVSLREGHTN